VVQTVAGAPIGASTYMVTTAARRPPPARFVRLTAAATLIAASNIGRQHSAISISVDRSELADGQRREAYHDPIGFTAIRPWTRLIYDAPALNNRQIPSDSVAA
jgi:hypothetical protein